MNDRDFYADHGYLHARGVFGAGEVEVMRGALERILAAVAGTEHDENHSWRAVTQESVLKGGFHNVQYHDAAFTRAAAHPGLVSVLTELIGPNVQLHHTKMQHVDWGQGLMVAGRNPVYWERRTRFQVLPG